jgi:Zn-dependent peptidase ImmA (M78 family)
VNTPHIMKLIGIDQRSLTYTDFEIVCDQQEILVNRANIKTPGMYFVCEKRPVITLSSKLNGVRLWLVAWHEFAHHLLHPPGLRCFSRGTVSKMEAEAQRLAIRAVIDEDRFYRILAQGELHDYPADMLRLRMKML